METEEEEEEELEAKWKRQEVKGGGDEKRGRGGLFFFRCLSFSWLVLAASETSVLKRYSSTQERQKIQDYNLPCFPSILGTTIAEVLLLRFTSSNTHTR